MKVEIWSDVVCPWCYIGKRRFETALAGFEHRDHVEVRWRSFELDPSAPRQRSEPNVDRLAAKYGVSRAQAEAMQQRVAGAGAEDGLAFRFDIARSGSTFDAHRVLHLAADRGREAAANERFFSGYFTEGAAIGEAETLVRLAGDAGLDEADVEKVLAGDAYADAVRADEAEARRLGISGVPFFVFGRAYGVSGAQPADLFAEVLAKVWDESHALDVVATGEVCEDDICIT